MHKLAARIINSISLWFLHIFRCVSTTNGPAPVEDARQIEQPPVPEPYTRYEQYVHFTAEWMDEHWPIFSRWARRVLDHLLPADGQVHDPQPAPTNRGPHPAPVAAFPYPPPPAHYAD